VIIPTFYHDDVTWLYTMVNMSSGNKMKMNARQPLTVFAPITGAPATDHGGMQSPQRLYE
jgi:hypothetical protein